MIYDHFFSAALAACTRSGATVEIPRVSRCSKSRTHRTANEGMDPRQALVQELSMWQNALHGIPLLRCLDDQLGDLLRERQHRDVA
jgi:hypothetical protein